MKSQKGIRVIFDTNIWISYLIGKELRNLTELISSKRIEIVISEQLLTEIIEVTARSKFRKYFNTDKVDELISLINLLGAKFKIDSIPEICDDPKDNFLFGLIRESNAESTPINTVFEHR